MGSDIAPKVAVNIAGVPLSGQAINFVQSVSVELAQDKADMITLVVANPIIDVPGEVRTSALLWTDALAWQPGNVVEVYLSYGDDEPELVAAGVIRRWMPSFPADGMPTITITALDGACLMMDGTDDVSAGAARTFDEGFTLLDMVVLIADDYGFDIDFQGGETEPAVPTIKKAGMSDYAFVQGLANLVGNGFWVDWTADSQKWTLHWRPLEADDSDVKRFVWGPDFENGDGDGNLIDFYPEFAIQNQSTDVELYYYDRDTKTWEQVVYPEEGKSSDRQSFEWAGDDTTVEADLQAVGDWDAARGLRIKAGGTSVEVLPTQGFKSAEEALNFARDWWQARNSLLIQGSGTIIGYPKLKAGQVHDFGGIGLGLSGNFFIAECSHE